MEIRLVDCTEYAVAVAQIEAKRHSYTDPDFGEAIRPYAWDMPKIQDFVATQKKDGRFKVAVENGQVVGAIAYVVAKSVAYQVKLFTYSSEEARDFLYEKIIHNTRLSPSLKAVEFTVNDGDDELTKYLLGKGLPLKRGSVDSLGVIDTWCITFTQPPERQGVILATTNDNSF